MEIFYRRRSISWAAHKAGRLEYKDILDRAVSRPQNTYYIEDIILEEARTYLSGVKTAKQVAEIIQNRVQLYLNEQQ